ncbi:hypothetical protein OLP57_03725 [Campylobacter jejuni]|uniref:hypothetical protein n=1 Tax=Campylobacter jejuni TaxID=197 RepID=UPI000F8056B1|nr:hypothetical protein [Campylobacter jejuni]MCW1341978.1 hypothetical protein [Campylobacter jejuni]RTI81556.1 hypothetical protein C3I08_05225 [Campylobacter jejuni]RTJ51615.1 hypothetical protein C3H65_03770 [Campylobacter jejuni]HBK6302705.1 hypothetical protein [Campylobacter jejuni]
MNLILENVSEKLIKVVKVMAKIAKSKASVLNDYELKAYKEYLESGKKVTLASDLYKELSL